MATTKVTKATAATMKTTGTIVKDTRYHMAVESEYTGLLYAISEHAALRMFERFETINIPGELEAWYNLMHLDTVDALVVNMRLRQHLAVEDEATGKVYVMVFNMTPEQEPVLVLKTVFKNTERSRFFPNEKLGHTKYILNKEGLIEKWKPRHIVQVARYY